MKQTVAQQAPLRLYVLWSLVGWAMVGGVIYLSLTADPIQTPNVQHGDKVGHFLAYFALTAWFAQLYPRRMHWVLMVMFIIMGVGLEYIQGMVGYRMFQYGDMVANALGAVIAWALAGGVLGAVLALFERRWLKLQPNVADGAGAATPEPPILTQQQSKDNG